MRLTPSLLKKAGTASSNRWLQRQSRDPYVQSRVGASSDRTSASRDDDAGGGSYRSRSAFKLVSLADRYPTLLGPFKRIVDLGAAPGGWSQVAARRLSRNAGDRVIAVDLLPISPILQVEVIRGDFLNPDVQKEVLRKSGGRVDTVLSDMMGSMSGVRDRDVQMSLDLCMAATEFGRSVLQSDPERKGTAITPDAKDSPGADADIAAEQTEEEVARGGGPGQGQAVSDSTRPSSPAGPSAEKGRRVASKGRNEYTGGNMVLKFFAHPDLDAFKREELDPWFTKVVVDKPKESRKGESFLSWCGGSLADGTESSEAYFVCLGFKGPPSVPS